jgi:hypothetical protein
MPTWVLRCKAEGSDPRGRQLKNYWPVNQKGIVMREFFVEHEDGSDLIEAPNLETAYEIANELGLVIYSINEA